MIPPALHPREAVRLKVLDDTGLFRNPQDRQYDGFVALASAIAETPIALFTLIDADRQWFRARIGLDTSIGETPRNVSFCGHAILQEQEPMIVEDTYFDLRFCDNPYVVNDPKVRFYAGVPICPSSHPIGTICVIDRKPRSLDRNKIEGLVALGKLVEQHIANTVKMARLSSVNDDLQALLEQRRAT